MSRLSMFRPRRSVLYMPGSNARALEKAKTLDADSLILDLEDAVAPEQKVLARQQVCDAVTSGGYGKRELVIRVNGFSTDWGEDDIQHASRTSADAICLPKVETPHQVLHAVNQMEKAGAAEDMAIWAMIETPKGVLNCAQIAAVHPRLRVLVMGTSDLSKELRVPHTPDRLGFVTSLSLCVLAARASNLDIIDGVQLDLSDDTLYANACEQGRALGFDGKSLIHPKQVELANQIFGPSPAAVEQAHRIISAWQTARDAGQGVAVLDGKLVENLHVDEAQRTLQIAAALD